MININRHIVKSGFSIRELKNGLRNLGQFAADESAAMSINDTVVSIVILAIIMGLCAMIVANIQPYVTISDTNNTEAVSAVTNIFDMTWNALSLLPIVLIVLVAVVVIGAVYLLTPGRN